MPDGHSSFRVIGDLDADFSLHGADALNLFLSQCATRVGEGEPFERRGLRSWVIRRAEGGYEREVARLAIGKHVTLRIGRERQEVDPDQAKAILVDLKRVEKENRWPDPLAARCFDDFEAELKEKGGKPILYPCRSSDSDFILMIQQRIEIDRAPFKRYVNWTHFNNGKWYPAEPDLLPLYGLEQLKGCTPRVMVHEGAKAAHAVRQLVERGGDHPLIAELKRYLHLGWVGGALSPHRTEWGPLKRLAPETEIVFVADHDEPGEAAIPKIADILKRSFFKVLFDNRFGDGFDFADPWPAIFGSGDRYQGPALGDLIAPVWSLLDGYNNDYCVVSIKGKARVLYCEEEDDGRVTPVFQRFEDFRSLHNHKRVHFFDESGKPKNIGEGSWWLAQEQRRQYKGITFQPSGRSEIKGKFNLWRGWGIEPQAGEWPLLKAHILDILARGNPDHASYIEKWAAYTLQYPNDPAEVAICFRGIKGSGKGSFCRAMKEAYGGHGRHISNPEHLSGRFNSHLADCVLLFADEAYWPGNKSKEGDLKRLITEPTLFIEPKGVDAFEIMNKLHLMIAANADWIIPATKDERRFAVFDVDPVHAQDRAYFEPLHSEMRNGGIAAMMHDLLNRDLETWHPRNNPPWTDALVDQIMKSLPPEEQWWLGLLQAGSLPGSDSVRPDITSTEELWRHAKLSVSNIAYSFTSELAMMNYLKNKRGVARGPGKDYRMHSGKRGWEFPSLLEARKQWEREIRQQLKWDTDTDKWIWQEAYPF